MTGEVYVYEAESLFLDDFYSVSGSQASGGQLIRIGGCDYEASASTTFGNPSGMYQLTIWIQDESDGQSTLEVLVNGVVVGTIILDQDSDGGGSNNGGFTAFTLDDILVNQGDTVELRGHRDGNEYVRIDKMEFVKTGDIGASTQTAAGTETLMSESFDGNNYGNLANSANVENSDFYRVNNSAVTNGNHDGTMSFRSVDLSGYSNAKLTLDAKVVRGGFEQWGTQYGDMVRIELVDQNGTVIVLDQFTGTGNTLIGNVTGQAIDRGGFDGLQYDLPAGVSSFQLRIVSDISARCEKIAFDNVSITADPDASGGGTGGGSGGGTPPPGPVTITIDAVDDAYSIGETETLAANILTNDTTDAPGGMTILDVSALGAANTGVGAVGQSFSVVTAGGRTGTVTIDAQGNLNFDGGTNFVDLMNGQTDSFQLQYTIRAAAADQPKHNLLFVLDISNSTVNGNSTQQDIFVGTGVGDVNGDGKSDTVLDAQIAGVIAAVQNLIAQGADPSKIDIGLVTFSGKASGYTNIDAETLGTFALDSAGLINALTGIDSGGWTNYEAGLQQARDWFASQQGDGAINKMYFLSDGRPAIGYQNGQYIYQNQSNYGDEVASIANTYGAEIHAIGVGANSDLVYLNQLDNTGGAQQILDTTTLTAVLQNSTDIIVDDTATITVTINGTGTPNLAPVAIDDANAGNEDAASISGNVLVNDSDPDGDAISVVSAGGQAIGSVIAVSGVSSGGLALDGTLTVNANGSYSFVPGAGYNALKLGESVNFSINYTIEDTGGLQDTATLTITVNGLNEGPIATANVYATGEGVDLTGNILTEDTGNGLDSDPNGDAFGVVDVLAGGTSLGAVGSAVTVTSAGGRTGTLTVNPDGSFTFQPGTNFDDLNNGEVDTVSLQYTIEDIHGARSTANFVIDVQGSGTGGGNPGGGPAINVMFVVDASSSMFVDNGVALALSDQNGDGVANTSFDLAYMGINGMIADLVTQAQALGVNLNVGLAGFDDGQPNGGGFDLASFTWDPTTGMSAWNSNVTMAGSAGNSLADAGMARGKQWFQDIGASMADDNQMVFLTDGAVDTANAAATAAAFATGFGGDVHARYVGSLGNLGPNWAAISGVINELDTTGLDANLTPSMLAYDAATMQSAMNVADILQLV